MAEALEIVELTPQRIDDYLAFFDVAFRDNPYWAGCYCGYYDDLCSDEAWRPATQGAVNRANRASVVRSGRARGVLAYSGGRVVGWCNAAPRSSYANLRAYAAAVEDPADDPGLVMCFVIDPDHRREGVGTALLEGALDAFRRQGLPWAEAYPRRAAPDDPAFPWTAAFYKGSLAMYEKAGFMVHGGHEHGYVVRRPL
jgi:GNAT superfamily N-acetyltransferase